MSGVKCFDIGVALPISAILTRILGGGLGNVGVDFVRGSSTIRRPRSRVVGPSADSAVGSGIGVDEGGCNVDICEILWDVNVEVLAFAGFFAVRREALIG